MRVGSLHGAAPLWRDQGKVSECFLKSCGCFSMVSGSGTAFELGVRSSLFVLKCIYTKILFNETMFVLRITYKSLAKLGFSSVRSCWFAFTC